MEKCVRFIFCPPGGKWGRYLSYVFSDLKHDDRVIWLNGRLKELNNPVMRAMRRVHFSAKLNRIVKLPFKDIWKTTLDDIQWDNNTYYYIVFFDSIMPVSPRRLSEYQNSYHVKYILYMVNSMIPPHDARMKASTAAVDFKYVFTFDIGDAETYGLFFNDNIYSKFITDTDKSINNDLYYIGGNNGRFELAVAIYDRLRSHGVIQRFRITDVSEKQQVFKDEICYNTFIDYKDSLKEMLNSNCILELMRVHENRKCATQRYYEAICYNKKLLTNNKNVVNLPFYNPDYIHVFERPEDIDWNWVKERVPVDYHYDGRFSPIHLLERIIELESAIEQHGKSGGVTAV